MATRAEPSKAAMKAALRVLTALSERNEPDPADIDELHWYAPADRERPIDELVCDAIQRALKDREEKRKAVKVRERAQALSRVTVGVPGGTGVYDEETERQIREAHERRQEYRALSAKLKRLGEALQHAGADIASDHAEAAKESLEAVAAEVDISGIADLLREHSRLARLLVADDRQAQKRRMERG